MSMTERCATGAGDVAVLVTGARGQLGKALLAAAAARGIRADGRSSAELDITDPDAVDAAVAELAAAGGRPFVMNAAAYTAVDAAETNAPAAYAINATGPGHLAGASARHNVGLIHVSTDYVFSGKSTTPYRPSDPTGPRSVYGASKLAGEQAVQRAHPAAYVVRTSGVYGATGANFVKTMIRLEAAHPTITVVNDQQVAPTFSADLAAGLLELATARPLVAGGILHATGGGGTTWYGFARAIFSELGADPDRVRPIATEDYPLPACRPAYSLLSQQEWQEAGLPPLRHWRQALTAAFVEHGPQLQHSS